MSDGSEGAISEEVDKVIDMVGGMVHDIRFLGLKRRASVQSD